MSFADSHLGQIRQKWGSSPILFPGVFVLVMNAKEQTLLGWRNDFNGWSAFGGSMEIDESITQTLHREILEETGVAVKNSTFIGMMTAPRYNVVYPHGDVTQSVNAVFVVDLDHEDVKMDEEHSRFEWHALDSLPENVLPQTLALIENYQEFRRTGVVQID